MIVNEERTMIPGRIGVHCAWNRDEWRTHDAWIMSSLLFLFSLLFFFSFVFPFLGTLILNGDRTYDTRIDRRQRQINNNSFFE